MVKDVSVNNFDQVDKKYTRYAIVQIQRGTIQKMNYKSYEL